MVGENTVNVIVTAEDGTQKTYVITVTRARELNHGATLESLTVIAGDDTHDYDMSTGIDKVSFDVAYDITNIKIIAKASDSNALVSGDGKQSLVVGKNTFCVTVVAEDGETTQEYEIVVNRADKTEVVQPSTDATLARLEASAEGSINVLDVSDAGRVYSFIYGNSIESINISAIANDVKATVEGAGNKALATGVNVFTVTVIAEDGTTKLNYVITVIREEPMPVFIAVEKVVLVNAPATLTVGDSWKISALVNPSNATNQTIIWSISSKSTANATLTDGKLTVNSAGTVVLVATIQGGLANGDFTAEFSFEVKAQSSSAEISLIGATTISVKKGAKMDLASKISNPDGVTLVYTSSNASIASVDGNGIITGGAKTGKATINVYTSGNLSKPVLTVSVSVI
jgi:hypothetical protein